MALSRHEHDPCASGDFLRRVPVRDEALQSGAVSTPKSKFGSLLAHPYNESYSQHSRIQLFVTEH
jgi:hypothetical protein